METLSRIVWFALWSNLQLHWANVMSMASCSVAERRLKYCMLANALHTATSLGLLILVLTKSSADIAAPPVDMQFIICEVVHGCWWLLLALLTLGVTIQMALKLQGMQSKSDFERDLAPRGQAGSVCSDPSKFRIVAIFAVACLCIFLDTTWHWLNVFNHAQGDSETDPFFGKKGSVIPEQYWGPYENLVLRLVPYYLPSFLFLVVMSRGQRFWSSASRRMEGWTERSVQDTVYSVVTFHAGSTTADSLNVDANSVSGSFSYQSLGGPILVDPGRSDSRGLGSLALLTTDSGLAQDMSPAAAGSLSVASGN
jgi:hypothetical protein